MLMRSCNAGKGAKKAKPLPKTATAVGSKASKASPKKVCMHQHRHDQLP